MDTDAHEWENLQNERCNIISLSCCCGSPVDICEDPRPAPGKTPNVRASGVHRKKAPKACHATCSSP